MTHVHDLWDNVHTTNDRQHGLSHDVHLALPVSASKALVALLAQLPPHHRQRTRSFPSVLRVHLPEAFRCTTSLNFKLHFVGTDIDSPLHVAIATCQLDVEIVHSTFLRQINGSIPRMMQTSFLKTREHRCGRCSQRLRLTEVRVLCLSRFQRSARVCELPFPLQ